MSSELLTERAERLARFAAKLSVSNAFPLLFESPLSTADAARLAAASREYIVSSLEHAHPTRSFREAGDPLIRFPDEVLALPNRTPNGLVLPKSETSPAYNTLHACIAGSVRGFGIDSLIQSIQLPINVRVASGRFDPETDARPLASSKLHSDIWAGELPQTLTMFFPLLGRIDEVGIDFAEPRSEFLSRFKEPLSDYDEGADLTEGARPYPCPIRAGHVYFTDPFLLHRTVKGVGALRLSIDIRVRAIQCVAGDVEFESERSANFVPLEDWYAIGSSVEFRAKLPMGEFVRESAVGPSPIGRRGAQVAPYRLIAK